MNESVIARSEAAAPPARLAEVVSAAGEGSARALGDARAARDRLRRELEAAEAAVLAAEVEARRKLEASVRDWCAAQARQSAEALDRAHAWTIAAELDELAANRDVVLVTIHRSLHREIAQTFDRRIAELEARAHEHQPLGDDPEPPGPVVVGAAWARQEPPAIELVVLDLGVATLEDAAREALSELSRRLGGTGQVRAAGDPQGAVRLVADVRAANPSGEDAARALSERIGAGLADAGGWPPAAATQVQLVEGDPALALQAALDPVGAPA